MKEAVPGRHLGLRAVSAAEMADIDRRAIGEFGIPAIELMENAGRAVAREMERFLTAVLKKGVSGSVVGVCCGRGNNGGDGLVAGRYLKEAGAGVFAVLSPLRRDRRPSLSDAGPAAGGRSPTDLGGGIPSREGSVRRSPEVEENFRRAAAAGVELAELGRDRSEAELESRLKAADALIDAVLGTGSSGKPAGAARDMIRAMARSGRPVVSIDIPSGIHPDTGYHSGAFVSAALTLALGLPKRGLLAPHAARNVGELRVLDIGLPKELLS